jgi:hypothetical protein
MYFSCVHFRQTSSGTILNKQNSFFVFQIARHQSIFESEAPVRNDDRTEEEKEKEDSSRLPLCEYCRRGRQNRRQFRVDKEYNVKHEKNVFPRRLD